ncbi:hypothetical protein Y032_0211g2216 [Ancylostoma ceylanicum]|uniref:Uncharacterized protein n=1 Tax=Ancylostoma ceylanicum TaxID=53326 RepID=A0A016SLA7_9BILA|nr:hypothetical protein Y032_0211g2216 [Ancylostoma ceylanicum]
MNRKVLRPRPDSAHWLHKNCGSRTGFFNSFARNHVYRSDQQSLKNRSMRKSRIDSEFALIAVIFIDYKNRLGFFDVYNWLLIAAIISPVPIMCIYLVGFRSDFHSWKPGQKPTVHSRCTTSTVKATVFTRYLNEIQTCGDHVHEQIVRKPNVPRE